MSEHTNGDHNRLYDRMGRIEGLVESLTKSLDQFIDEVRADRVGQEKRIGDVEKDVSRAKGITAALSVVIGISVQYIKDLFHRGA